MKKKSLNKQIRRYIGKGKRYFSQNKFDKAIQCFDKAIEINPNIAEIYAYRGDVNYIIDEEQAIKDYTKAIKLNPKAFKAYYSRGLLYEVAFNECSKAIADYTKAIDINSNNYDVYNCRANVYMQVGEYDKATEDFLKLLNLKKNPQNKIDLYNVYYKLGHLKLNQKLYKNAIDFYNKSLKQKTYIEELKFNSYFERGCCYMCTEEYENAISDFTQAINMALKNSNCSEKIAEFYSERAGAYLALGNKVAYESDLQTAEEFKSGNRVIEEEWTEA